MSSPPNAKKQSQAAKKKNFFHNSALRSAAAPSFTTTHPGLTITTTDHLVRLSFNQYGGAGAHAQPSLLAAAAYCQFKVLTRSVRVGVQCSAHDSDDVNGELGHDRWSWAWDGRSTALHAGERRGFGKGELKSGDVLGVGVDFDKRRILFWKNGECLGVAFDGFHAGSGGVAFAINLEQRGSVEVDLAATVPPVADDDAETRALLGDTFFCPLAYTVDAAKLARMEALYETYFEASVSMRGSSFHDAISGDGTMQLAADLGVEDLEDPTLMLLAWKFASTATWEFSRDEFVGALVLWDIDSLDALKRRVAAWRADIAAHELVFKDFYFFLFDYLKEGKTVLFVEECVMVWSALRMSERWPLFPRFAAFLQAEEKESLTRDSWRELLKFAQQYPENVNDFDESAAWPLLFDEFFEFLSDE